jgi:hypothetical protein
LSGSKTPSFMRPSCSFLWSQLQRAEDTVQTIEKFLHPLPTFLLMKSTPHIYIRLKHCSERNVLVIPILEPRNVLAGTILEPLLNRPFLLSISDFHTIGTFSFCPGCLVNLNGWKCWIGNFWKHPQLKCLTKLMLQTYFTNALARVVKCQQATCPKIS